VTVLLLFFGEIADNVAQVINGFGIIVVHRSINTDFIRGFVFAAVVIAFSSRYFPPYCSYSLSYWVGSWLTETPDKAMPAVTRNIDRSIWRDLMLKSGMMALMDAQARDQWHKNLEEGDLPTISEANILSTFEQLHLNKMDVFERGIINVFKGLSWDYKTNSPSCFGKKIIINNLVTHNRWGFSLNWGGGGTNWRTWSECYFCLMVNRSLTTGAMSLPG